MAGEGRVGWGACVAVAEGCMAGGMYGGACVVGGGVCMQERRSLKWVVRILLECILVYEGVTQTQGPFSFMARVDILACKDIFSNFGGH